MLKTDYAHLGIFCFNLQSDSNILIWPFTVTFTVIVTKSDHSKKMQVNYIYLYLYQPFIVCLVYD